MCVSGIPSGSIFSDMIIYVILLISRSLAGYSCSSFSRLIAGYTVQQRLLYPILSATRYNSGSYVPYQSWNISR